MNSADQSPGAVIGTKIASTDRHNIWIRGQNLTEEIMGHRSFADVVFLLVGHRYPDSGERRLIDAVLVSLMEHGLTPSAIVSRLTYSVSPESFQGAVAAGLLGAGSQVLGSMEECGRLLTRIVAEVQSGASLEDSARGVVAEYRQDHKKIPGVGHVVHTDGDPRAGRLLAIAVDCGKSSSYVEAVQVLARTAEESSGRRLPLNVTGAIAAVLLELGIPWQLHRGLALVSRSVGLIAHLDEERTDPIAPTLRQFARGEAVTGPDGSHG